MNADFIAIAGRHARTTGSFDPRFSPPVGERPLPGWTGHWLWKSPRSAMGRLPMVTGQIDGTDSGRSAFYGREVANATTTCRTD